MVLKCKRGQTLGSFYSSEVVREVRRRKGLLILIVLGMSAYAFAAGNEYQLISGDGSVYLCCHTFDECCTSKYDNCIEVVYVGDDYIITMYSSSVISEFMLNLDSNIAPLQIECCSNPNWITTSINTFHTIWTNVSPRTCVDVTVVTAWSCTRCWSSHNHTTFRPGCGTRCPYIR